MSRTEHHYNCDYPFAACTCDSPFRKPDMYYDHEPKRTQVFATDRMPNIGWPLATVMLNMPLAMLAIFNFVSEGGWLFIVALLWHTLLAVWGFVSYRRAIERRGQIRAAKWQAWMDRPIPRPSQETVTWPEYEAQVERMLKDYEDPYAAVLDFDQVNALALSERRRQESELARRREPEPHPDSLAAFERQGLIERIGNVFRVPPHIMAEDEFPPLGRSVDWDARRLHAVFCNRSPENQARGLADVCNCPRAQTGRNARD